MILCRRPGTQVSMRRAISLRTVTFETANTCAASLTLKAIRGSAGLAGGVVRAACGLVVSGLSPVWFDVSAFLLMGDLSHPSALTSTHLNGII